MASHSNIYANVWPPSLQANFHSGACPLLTRCDKHSVLTPDFLVSQFMPGNALPFIGHFYVYLIVFSSNFQMHTKYKIQAILWYVNEILFTELYVQISITVTNMAEAVWLSNLTDIL